MAMMATATTAGAKPEFSETAAVPATVTFSGATLTVAGKAVGVPPAALGGTLTLTITGEVEEPTFKVTPTTDCVTITAGPIDAGVHVTAAFDPEGEGETTTVKRTVNAATNQITATICSTEEPPAE